MTAIKTNKPFVEQEKNEFDVTLPSHDSSRKIIATAAMDFKLEPGRTKVTVAREAQKVEVVFRSLAERAGPSRRQKRSRLDNRRDSARSGLQ